MLGARGLTAGAGAARRSACGAACRCSANPRRQRGSARPCRLLSSMRALGLLHALDVAVYLAGVARHARRTIMGMTCLTSSDRSLLETDAQ